MRASPEGDKRQGSEQAGEEQAGDEEGFLDEEDEMEQHYARRATQGGAASASEGTGGGLQGFGLPTACIKRLAVRFLPACLHYSVCCAPTRLPARRRRG
mgnify:CR=1 FL=1